MIHVWEDKAENKNIEIEIELYDTSDTNKEKLIEAGDEIAEALKGTSLLGIIIYVGYEDIIMKGMSRHYRIFIRVEKDLSNLHAAIDEFVKMWLDYDTPERLG